MIKFRNIAALLAIPGALALPAQANAGYAVSSAAIGVYQLNINQMTNNWSVWVDTIKLDPTAPIPDIILGQDFADLAQIDQFRNHISSSITGFGTTYTNASRLAGNNQVVIFWRTQRFPSSQVDGWYGHGGSSTEPCVLGANNARAVQVRLWDSAAGRYVGAVSMKTPPKGTNSECAKLNMQLATQKLDRNDASGNWRGDLRFVGTDANTNDWNGSSYRCWWDETVAADGTNCGTADLGWSDVIYNMCNGQRSCLDNEWTHSGNRIDFLFAKKPAATAGSTNQRTVGRLDCTTFSNHCSVGAAVEY